MFYEPFGEVVESALAQWTVQSWQWDVFPPFGALVALAGKENTLFGVVAYSKTGSFDATRQAIAYQLTEEELLQQQPQIYAFLQTQVYCQSLGYEVAGKPYYILPQRPPAIHLFARLATPDELKSFCRTAACLQVLIGQLQQLDRGDDLLLALLQWLDQQRVLTRSFLLEFAELYSLAVAGDYRRMKFFMSRLHSLDMSI